MKRIFTPLALLFALSGTLRAQSFDWAYAIGDTGADDGTDLTTDAAGNVYITGRFEGTVDFDPGTGTYPLTAPVTTLGERDIFICKYTSAGAFVWAKQISARTVNTYEYRPVIALDGSGNVIISGLFQGTQDFNPGTGTFMMTAGSVGNLFLEKLDNNGNFIWAKCVNGNSWQMPSDLQADASGNIYLGGYLQGTADFDMDAGVHNLTAASTSTPAGFIAKYDASGALSWANQIGGSTSGGTFDVVNALALDPSGNVYVTGSFDGTEDLDPGAATLMMTAGGAFQAFVMKLTNAGNLVWVKQTQGGSSSEIRGNSIAVDANGNTYYTGDYYGTVDLDPGAGLHTITSSGTNTQIFVSKLDNAGNFAWGGMQGGDGTLDFGSAITLDNNGNVYCTGFFSKTVDFDMSSAVHSVTSTMPGFTETYINKMDANGNFVWVKVLENGNIYGTALAVDPDGDIYVTGQLNDYWNVDFDPDTAAVHYITAAGQTDAYLLKLKSATAGVDEKAANAVFAMYPNPSAELVNIYKPMNGQATMRLFSLTGELLLSHTMNGNTDQIDVSGLSNGIYFLQLQDEKGNISSQKLQVMH